MDQLNTREIASIVWMIIFFVVIVFYSLKNLHLRSSLIAIIKSFFHIKIITSILFITSYLTPILWLLYQLQIWDFSQLKNTFFWYITFAIGTLFNINTIKENSQNFFIGTIKSSINLSIFLQFIINFHTFNLLIELIIIFPIITILTVFSTVAQHNPEHLKVKKLCDSILIIIFFIFFTHFLIQIFRDLSKFANYQTLQDFLTPIFLTILYLPFLWFFLLYIKYEEIFVRLHFFIDNKKLISLTKFLVIINFRTQKDLIDEWFHHIKIHKIGNYQQLIKSFSLIKQRNMKRKHLIEIPLKKGWSAHKAENYLTDFNIKIKYTDIGDDTWFGSKILKLDNDFNPSTLTYYIQGNEDVVDQLKIKLFLYELDLLPQYLSIYTEAINCLLWNALNVGLNQDQIDNIYSLENFLDTLHDKQIGFQYETFTHSLPHTYELSFCIKNPS
ncbi:hypothetical protein [Acinetobacter haemolyticus]|uniref:hypothetical protein n=3 Tax=Acinetobacter TaxID=469 RepID=UPI0002FADDAB|nr:hypothetical protein [Acinetobacter haemolyticus]NAR67621.1 hypothetical protein [Acinetobacter haemolyticus]NAR71048.1 hypothetical protein [Acinetobacter haemolyticus]NAS00438.1 hypothetical protein [Acinetobacter haemolyticus]QHI22301.1 hypothetical protein Ahae5227_04745 [Acinetobacter haemolyticus]QHI25600.1 hypothetical protein Ahae2126ch_04935 [Acinetobacter haemolyticus]